jgi:hypothetical protein
MCALIAFGAFVAGILVTVGFVEWLGSLNDPRND